MENNIKYIVYCTTNLVNNKIYIGVHKTNPDYFDGYLGNGCYANSPSTYSDSKTVFRRALIKYGPKNFRRVTIATFDNADDAYMLEADIVDRNFLQRPDVYNLALGGYGGNWMLNCKATYQYDENGNFINEFESIHDASRVYNVNLRSIQRAIEDKCKCRGFFWTTTKFDKLDLSKMKAYEGLHCIPTYQYSSDGQYDCCYESIREASRVTGIHHTNISNAIKLGTICNNKYFTNTFSPNYSVARSKQIQSYEVHQYDLDGNYITSYPSMAKAKKATGIKSDIYKAIRLKRTAGNYQWSFEKLDKMPKVLPKSGRARRVGKYDKDWNLIKEYPTLQSCKDENGSGMIHVLDGRDEFAKGFRYKYLD